MSNGKGISRCRVRTATITLMATLFAIVFTLPLTETFGAEGRAKVLYFTRQQGFEHTPTKLQDDGTTVSGAALTKYCDARNIELVCTQDGRVFDGDIDQYDAFVFYTSGQLEAAHGSKNPTAHAISSDGIKKFFAAVKGGKGFVCIHSANVSSCSHKDDKGFDLYTKLVGGRFLLHANMQDAPVLIVSPVQLPWLKDKGDTYMAHEEWPTFTDYNPDMHVVLVQETAGMTGDCYNRPNYPSSWIRMEGQGRVAYSAFGHVDAFWQNDENVRKIGEMIEWTIRRFDMDTTPNFDIVTPLGNELHQPKTGKNQR